MLAVYASLLKIYLVFHGIFFGVLQEVLFHTSPLGIRLICLNLYL